MRRGLTKLLQYAVSFEMWNEAMRLSGVAVSALGLSLLDKSHFIVSQLRYDEK